MDPVDGGRLLHATPCGGISHGLAGLGARDAGDHNAHHNVPNCECSSCDCGTAACSRRMATTCTQPPHSIRDSCQCALLSHTPHCCAAQGIARHLHRCASVSAV